MNVKRLPSRLMFQSKRTVFRLWIIHTAALLFRAIKRSDSSQVNVLLSAATKAAASSELISILGGSNEAHRSRGSGTKKPGFHEASTRPIVQQRDR